MFKISIATNNIGTGNGFSVLQVIKAFEEESNIKLNYVIGEKRSGDAASIYADVTKANTILNWSAKIRFWAFSAKWILVYLYQNVKK